MITHSMHVNNLVAIIFHCSLRLYCLHGLSSCSYDTNEQFVDQHNSKCDSFVGNDTFSETILESPVNSLKELHATRTGGSLSFGLLCPII